jgi:predicted metal-binding membrane protein
MASILPSATRPDAPPGTISQRAVVIGSIAGITLLAWVYLLYQAWAMDHMDTVVMTMPGIHAWGMWDLTLVFTMWAVMMVGMMAPSVSPVVLLFARIQQQRRAQGQAFIASWLFLLGYLIAWTGFSLAATLAQWGLHAATLISPAMVGNSPFLGGAVLIAAGIYQWTPAKRACLARCRSPLSFLLNDWRDGNAGALAMGARHGLYCTGCCWLLMLVLFVVGVMNLLWIALLTLFVLLEKTLPRGLWISRASGAALIAWGGWMVSVALV